MTSHPQLNASLVTIGIIVAAMVTVAAIEAAAPLHPRNRWSRLHLAPNLALTAITFATNLCFNIALVSTLTSMQATASGLLRAIALPELALGALAVVALDFSFYVAHVTMHAIPGFWRFHAVHHADPMLDVTTTIRQHPGESVIRFGFMAITAIGLGVSPAAFAVYRLWSTLNGLFEHANIRMPRRLDHLLTWIITTPDMHKVHHSRTQPWTDTNYGNIFSMFDRGFSTFTPSSYGTTVTYGLEGGDVQSTGALLAMPFRGARSRVALMAD